MDNATEFYNDKSWTELSEPVRKQDLLKTPSDKSTKTEEPIKHRTYSTPVLTFQLILCLIVLTVLFLLKTFSVGLYANIREWYDTEMSSTLYFSGDLSNIDYSHIFSASSDEF